MRRRNASLFLSREEQYLGKCTASHVMSCHVMLCRVMLLWDCSRFLAPSRTGVTDSIQILIDRPRTRISNLCWFSNDSHTTYYCTISILDRVRVVMQLWCWKYTVSCSRVVNWMWSRCCCCEFLGVVEIINTGDTSGYCIIFGIVIIDYLMNSKAGIESTEKAKQPSWARMNVSKRNMELIPRIERQIETITCQLRTNRL